MPEVLSADLFSRHGIDVSRETIEKFEIYQRLVLKWQKAINLVGPTTLDELPTRHFLDSAQLIRLIPDRATTLADLGSGAGFPGLVLALMGVAHVHLVESDVRKATFLREVSRETSAPVTVHDSRIEATEIDGVDLVTARALAPLRDLMGFVDHFGCTRAIFLKGAQYQDEIDQAKKRWVFDVDIQPSLTDPAARILSVSSLRRK